MKIVSLFGLVTLLGIAWIMSYHRKDIKYRTVIWGLVLQLDFAFIILQK
ncbi:MAG: NupC/NupG family nucleoside CNT transporter, partial [Candidatus Marinimicrobia bacterium]|nr:NupC/NupG family nucleoside CNT transporter [Candidatus Neomarinimicrobiota bacterium]